MHPEGFNNSQVLRKRIRLCDVALTSRASLLDSDSEEIYPRRGDEDANFTRVVGHFFYRLFAENGCAKFNAKMVPLRFLYGRAMRKVSATSEPLRYYNSKEAALFTIVAYFCQNVLKAFYIIII